MTLTDTVALQAYIDKGTSVQFDITIAASNWVNGLENYGILVKDVQEITIVLWYSLDSNWRSGTVVQFSQL